MPFLIVDAYTGDEPLTVDTLNQVFDYYKDQDVAERGGYRGDNPRVYEVAREVEIVTNPATYSVVNPSTDIPAPRPGETVSDYARRITGA